MHKIVSFLLADTDLYQIALGIREQVFIHEQKVNRTLEIENEDQAHFYMIYENEIPAGTGRWRLTESGIKFERFAVLPKFRNKGLGSILLKKILSDLENTDQKIYLHSQLKAVPYYERQGFIKEGNKFVEAEIEHYLMIIAPGTIK